MYTVRQLIIESYRISGMHGIGSTPSDSEMDDAKDLINGILDVFSLQSSWAPGIIQRAVTSKPDGTIVIANDQTRVITRYEATVAPDQITITTAGQNNVTIGDFIVASVDNILTTLEVLSVVSLNTFITNNPSAITGVWTSGVYKFTHESDDYLIDLVVDSPVSIHGVLDGTGYSIPAIQGNVFYSSNEKPYGWYYELATDPYPKLFLPTYATTPVTLTFNQPGWRDVNLNTDMSLLPIGVKQMLKWRLAGDLAQINGFTDQSTTCLARYYEAAATYRRSRHRLNLAEGDMSASGRGGRYNITTDEFV